MRVVYRNSKGRTLMDKKQDNNRFGILATIREQDTPERRFSVNIDLHLRLKEELIAKEEEGDPLYMPVDYSPREPNVYSDRKIPELPISIKSQVENLIGSLREIKNYNSPIIKNKEDIIVESYAIVLISISREDECTVLLGQRRDSIEYSDFVRGLYIPSDLVGIISMMTKDERERVLRYDISILWSDYWPINSASYHKSRAYNHAKRVYNTNIEVVRKLIGLIDSKRLETEWLLPRGRAKDGSTVGYEDVAVREFEEETCLSLEKCRKSIIQPYRELYTGSNGMKFATTHYIYITENEMLPRKKRIEGIIRRDLVSNDFDMVKWCNLEECKLKLNVHRYKAIEELFRLVNQRR